MISGAELDGVRLMRKVFANDEPIFIFSDQTTEIGRNIQKGYSEIFSGVLTGIRNPKAHKNMIIDSIDALEKIMLASHLLKIFEKRENQKS